MKRKKSKRLHLKWFIGILLIIAALIFAFLIMNHFDKTSKSKNSAKQTTTQAPIKVDSSKSDTVVSSSSVVAADDTEKVKNSGDPDWISISSKGSGEKFTNLSTANLTIYKAHNPQILKTATSTHPNLQVLSQVMSQYPNALIMNASGFNMQTGAITGFQINNGKLNYKLGRQQTR